MKAPADALIEAAQPMVHAVARVQHAHLGGELDDLVGDGLVALVEAAQRFDPERGVPFTAYARHRVRFAMVDGYRNRHRTGPDGIPVRFVPVHALETVDPDDYPWAWWVWHTDRVPTVSSAEDVALDNEAMRALEEKMAALPPALRSVVACALADHPPRAGSAGLGDGRWAELAAAEGVTPPRISQRRRELRRRLAA